MVFGVWAGVRAEDFGFFWDIYRYKVEKPKVLFGGFCVPRDGGGHSRAVSCTFAHVYTGFLPLAVCAGTARGLRS